MNGLTPAAVDALKAKISAFLDHVGDDVPKCDAAYDRLYPDQVDRFTFRQAWVKVAGERARAAAEGQESPQDEPPAGDTDQAPAGEELSQDNTADQEAVDSGQESEVTADEGQQAAPSSTDEQADEPTR